MATPRMATQNGHGYTNIPAFSMPHMSQIKFPFCTFALQLQMTRNRNSEDPVRAATQRKWSARAWWVGVHVYGYVLLGVEGHLRPQQLPTVQFALYIAAAVATISCYLALQLSSPGRSDKRPQIAAPVQSSVEFCSPAQLREDDTELLVTESASNCLHFCDECHAFQPLRAKHCKDCARCTLQYDHHCDCVGTCVGENNRRLFVLYLGLQILEGAVMLDVTSQAFSEGDDVNDWFKTNALFIVLWFMLVCVLLIVVSLFCYQAFLISTNQTSWEHARRSSITYLQNLPDKRSPFDRGVLRNWWVFLTNGDRNKWVHHQSAKPTSRSEVSSSLV